MEVFRGGSLRFNSFEFDFKHKGIRYLDSIGNQLSFVDSSGYWNKSTYDSDGNWASFVNNSGLWWKRTYDSSGNVLSYSNGMTY